MTPALTHDLIAIILITAFQEYVYHVVLCTVCSTECVYNVLVKYLNCKQSPHTHTLLALVVHSSVADRAPCCTSTSVTGIAEVQKGS